MSESEKHHLEHLPTDGEIAGTAEKNRLKEIEKNLTEGFESYIAAKKAMQRCFDGRRPDSAGEIALALGDTASAKEAMQRCFDEGWPVSASKIALALGDTASAKEAMQRCFDERRPESAGKIALALGDTASAKEAMQRCFDEGWPESAGKIAVALALGDTASAKEAMQRCFDEGWPESAGEIAVALGDTASAKEAMQRCFDERRPESASKIALALGDTASAKEAMQRCFDERRPESASKIALALGDTASAKEAMQRCFDERRPDSAGKIAVALGDTASAKEAMQRCFDEGWLFSAGKIAVALALGDTASAKEAMQRCFDGRRPDLAGEIAVELHKKYTQNLNISSADALYLLQTHKDKTALALGWFAPERAEETLAQIPNNQDIARIVALGKLLKLPEENYERALADIAFSSPDTPNFRRALSRSLFYHDYEAVSNILLQKTKDAQDEETLVRHLKTLIEIENPKGRTLATDLFANRHLNPHLRTYLAKKLIAEGHWDQELGPLFERRLKEGRGQEADDVLVAMIKDLGLTPDKPTYKALEKPGLLTGKTLTERVQEIKSLRQEFSELPLQELKTRLKNDRLRQIFYLVKGGEYRYTLINDYSYDKFSLVVKKILEQEVSEEKLEEFRQSLSQAGIPEKKQTDILTALQDGRFPLRDPAQRSFVFESNVELGSEHELALGRLQEIWGQELKALAITSESKEMPLGIDDALLKTQGKEITHPKTKRMLEFLKQGEKQDYQTLKKLAEGVKKELLFSARQRKDKTRMEEIERLNVSGLFYAYLSERLPRLKDSAILSEWESHLREVLSVLETGPIKGGVKRKKLELTFLDKSKDFIRAVRFADGQQCCFNSIHYRIEGDLGAADWIARLYADPLSFIMDIKEEGSRIISGFVFGRMGIDPETKRPVVMINGIYAQESGGTIADNILKLIEDKFGRAIGASSVVIASKHGGKLSKKPIGYESVQKNILAIRALKNNDECYDDIGTTANGEFTFEGYERQLR